jgi:hypothetical protein
MQIFGSKLQKCLKYKKSNFSNYNFRFKKEVLAFFKTALKEAELSNLIRIRNFTKFILEL